MSDLFIFFKRHFEIPNKNGKMIQLGIKGMCRKKHNAKKKERKFW